LFEVRFSAAKYYDPAATLSDDQIRELVRIGTTAPTSFHLQNWRFIAVRTPEAKARLRPIVGAAAMMYAARLMGLGTTPMIGFDSEAVAREFELADEVPVMLLSVGPVPQGNWPQKPRLPVADVLDLV
jgi:nitroreductase